MAELFASPQGALPEKPVIALGGQFEIISKCETVSFTWLCDQLCSSLKKHPKEMGLNG